MCQKCSNSSSNELNACGCSNASGKPQSVIPYESKVSKLRTQLTLDNIFDKVKDESKQVYEMAKKEVETIYDDVKSEAQRFDKKQRLIKSVPNSVLVFGAVGILAYSILK
jgi:hypothetical protein